MNRTLPFAGREIPRIGLGTNRLTDTPANVDFIRSAAAAGIGMIDTAHLYTGGQSERTIGAAAPADCVVATKGGFDGADPATLRAQIEQSLASLRTGRIDLYYLHRVDAAVPLETSVALGHLRENVAALEVRLSDEDYAAIGAA